MTSDGTPPRHLHPVEPPFDPDYDHARGPQRDRQPPADRDAEQAVLATLLIAPELGEHLAGELDSSDFYWPIHQQIWDTWHHVHTTDGVPPDAIVLSAALTKAGNTDAVRALTDLIGRPATPLLADQYTRLVRDTSRLRTISDLATGLHDIATKAKVDQVDIYLGEALQRLDETVMRFGATTTPHTTTGLADLTWILTGQAPTSPPPAWVQRTDGTALFYDGRVNGVFGDPEGGKTWLAQVAIVEALQAGRLAAMVDVDHNGQDHTAARLMLLGATMQQLANPDLFRYYEPEDGDQLRAAIHDITTLAPAVVVLDSIGEILPMLGVKSVDNDEITAALRDIAMPPAKAGSCVITIDHLPKSAEARTTGYAIGGTAKKRAIDGAYLRAEARQQPTPGGIGRITLRIEKDRTGELRKTSGGGYAGTFTLDSTLEHITTWTIGREDSPVTADGRFRPTHLMEAVSKFVEENDQCSFTEIKRVVEGQDKNIRAAIKVLVDEGFLSVIKTSKTHLHHSIALYREAEDDTLQ